MSCGCVASDTKIRMAGKQESRIDMVQIGDLVMGEDHNVIRVRNVIQGFEEKIRLVETEDGSSIMTTKDHPFVTKNGFVPAGELTVADSVLTKIGNYIRITVIQDISYNDTVYNLEIEGGKNFIGNGFVLGDYATQNKLCFEKNDRSHSLSAEELAQIEEFKKLFESM